MKSSTQDMFSIGPDVALMKNVYHKSNLAFQPTNVCYIKPSQPATCTSHKITRFVKIRSFTSCKFIYVSPDSFMSIQCMLGMKMITS